MRLSQFANMILERISARQELALVGLLVLTVGMMMLPVPTALADVLIASNIGLAFLLIMVSIYVASPVEFSTLPTIILITTAFRLSLSITTSRMVLVQGDAGDIIRAFGEFVIAGNIVVGLVVYLIITIVQFVVITKGSERVAEVAARFTLDALPGKQISIDTDLKNGDIDRAEARRRRQNLGRESQLYGAMDGAMKFVKGDAIASLVIIIVNLIGGITIGCLQRGLPFGQAVQTYSLLAVGDGLIAQIPALLISLTAGITVTRVTSDSGGNLGRDITSQLAAEPKTLLTCALVLGALAFVPSFPTSVFVVLSIILGTTGWALRAQANDRRQRFAEASTRRQSAKPEAATLELRLNLLLDEAGLPIDQVIDEMRIDLGKKLGIAVPRVRVIQDIALAQGLWRLDVNMVPAGSGVADDIDDVLRQSRLAIGRIAAQFVGIQETQALLTGINSDYADLVREATKAVPLTKLTEVLRRLVEEGVSIADLRAILETAAEWGPWESNISLLTEHVRVSLRRQICYAIAGPEKKLHMVLIDAPLDASLREAVQASSADTMLDINAAVSQRLLAALQQITASRPHAAVLAAPEVRRHLRRLLNRLGSDTSVLTRSEIPQDFNLEVLGTLSHAQIVPAPTAGDARASRNLTAISGRS